MLMKTFGEVLMHMDLYFRNGIRHPDSIFPVVLTHCIETNGMGIKLNS